MGCACSKAVAAATQDEIDWLTSKKPRRHNTAKQCQEKAKAQSLDLAYIPAAKLATVHEAR